MPKAIAIINGGFFDPNNSGMSLPAVADFLKSLGVQKAMNLDGRSSSSLYYNGKSFYGKVDLDGNFIKRPVKSVLLVQEKGIGDSGEVVP